LNGKRLFEPKAQLLATQLAKKLPDQKSTR